MPAKGNSAFYQPAKAAKKPSTRKPTPKPVKKAQATADPTDSSDDAAEQQKPKKKQTNNKEKEKGKEKAQEKTDDSDSSEEDVGELAKPQPKRGHPDSSQAPAKPPKKARHANPPAVKPRSAAFAKAMRALDWQANEATRIELKFEGIYNALRIVTRLGNISVNWDNVIVTGIANYHLEDEDHPFWDSENYDDFVEAYQTFPLLLKYVKGFENDINWLADNPDVMALAGDFAEKVAAKVRGDDLARLRSEIISLARIPNVDLALKDKANRGWESVRTGELLVPIRFLRQFQKDPAAFCRHAKKGEIHIHSGDWPALLYDVEQHDLKEPRVGLLRSPIGLAAYRLLFVSRTFAEGNNPQSGGKGQPPLCKKYNLTEVTLGSIIYTYTLIRSCLTAQSQWNVEDGSYFNCHDLAITLFEFAFKNADWCDELLAWWNKKIYDNYQDDEELKAELRETTYAIAMQNCTGRRKRPVRASPTSHAGPSKANDGAQGGDKTGAVSDKTGAVSDKTGADHSEASSSNSSPDEIEYAD